MVTELESDDADTAIDESSLSIAGGFGKVVLGGNDGVGDNYGVSSQTFLLKKSMTTGTLTTIAIQ